MQNSRLRAADILKIDKPGDLFTQNRDRAKAEYRELAKLWHPDVSDNPHASAVFEKVSELYSRAMELLGKGEWEKSCRVSFAAQGRAAIEFDFLTETPFELGTLYVSETKAAYVVRAQHRQFADNAVAQIKSLKFANDRMREEFSKYIPAISDTAVLKNGDMFIQVIKARDIYPMRAVIDSAGGAIEGHHAAWIISRLLNFSCFLSYNRKAHNGIMLDSLFICPEHHTVSVLGGWQYAGALGKKMIGTSKEVYDVMPVLSKSTKLSSTDTDIESIKLVGRTIAGNMGALPKAFREWLANGTGDDSIGEFRKWQSVLTRSYGERKFVRMNVDINKIYRKET